MPGRLLPLKFDLTIKGHLTLSLLIEICTSPLSAKLKKIQPYIYLQKNFDINYVPLNF